MAQVHLSPFENVIDQTEAMQAVAPPGFKLHYDFTMHGTDDHMIELLAKLARYPIAGCFEDVLPAQDLPGYIELRQRSPLPVVLHQRKRDRLGHQPGGVPVHSAV